MSTATVPALDHDFTLERLERLLRTDADVAWRHDVDFDPECALEMAQFEHRLGVRSTFYVMGRGDYYNPFGPKTHQMFREIIGYGHQLGLHVDLQVGRGAQVPTEMMRLACEFDWLLFQESNLDMTRKVTFHAPPHSVYWRDVPGFEHMLGEKWEGRYIGDSRGVWRQSPEEFLSDPTMKRFQLNLHPEWWFWPASIAEHSRKREAVAP